jgi:sulfane dehydrogenase subunit SoxC
MGPEQPPGEKESTQSHERDVKPGESTINRRTLLQLTGAVGAAAVVATAPSGFAAHGAQTEEATPPATGSALPPDVPPWMQRWGPLPSEYGERSSYESGVVRLPSPTSSRSPLQELHGTMTPGPLFFERHHSGIPEIDPALHRLIVHGMVERPVIYTMEDIKRFPAMSVIHFHECSGNSGSEWTEESIAPTAQSNGVDRRSAQDHLERSWG